MDQHGSTSDRRKRSRSRVGGSEQAQDVKRRRSRSPHRHKHHHHERAVKDKLPFRSRHLHKHDFEAYRALFGEYLDLQKQRDINKLDEDEVKGRWKSFLNKWNRGELAEGWYDPEMKQRADDRHASAPQQDARKQVVRHRDGGKRVSDPPSVDEGENEDDGFGPTPPPADRTRKVGPSVPNFQDLQYKHELAEEDRSAQLDELRYDRKKERKAEKERLEELVPRAQPGSRERQLEKKREATASNRAFAETKEAGAEEVGDGDLLGDDGVDVYKAKMRATEKRKNEREIRKEEVLRARAAEREERMAEHRRKEDKTMDMLRQLAQQRFGAVQ